MTRVFISYSRKDLDFVKHLAKDLKTAGLEVWYDLAGLEIGTRWGREIQSAIKQSQYFIVILSPNSTESEWVEKEFMYAYSLQRKIIPLLCQPCEMPMWFSNLHMINMQGNEYELNLPVILNALGVRPVGTGTAEEPAEEEKPAASEQAAIPTPPSQETGIQPVGIGMMEGPAAEDKPAASEQAAIPPPLSQETGVQPVGTGTAEEPAEEEKPAAAEQAALAKPPSRKVWVRPAWLAGLAGAAGVIAFAIWGLPHLVPASKLTPTSNGTATRQFPSTIVPANTSFPSATAAPPPTATAFNTLAAVATPVVWTRPADGMVMVYVPEGDFIMGSPEDSGDADEHPQHPVNLAAYWIDLTEVTNAMYAKCVLTGACRSPSSDSSYWRASYYGDPKYTDYPVIYVSWYAASAYCQWVGARLPSEAEWEKAARGTDGFTYPWGNTEPTQERLQSNYDNQTSDTGAVGSYPAGASPFGVLDMAGNVWEWTNDRYSKTYYSQSPSRDPQGPVSGSDRVIRGGSFIDGVGPGIRSASRDKLGPDRLGNTIGFRCSRSAP